ncbi:MAG: MOSC domain-containing protein [Pseudomonadota bacterium]|nr:MOSC domain-containing protein [Pseudomonadota bacterium]
MAMLTQLYRYPVKGLSPEPLECVQVSPLETLPGDRQFALARATSEFQSQAPRHLPKTQFLMLMKDEALAALNSVYDHSTGVLSIYHHQQLQIQGALDQVAGRRAIEAFFADYLALAEPPRLVQAPGHSFSDVAAKVLSCINLASIRALETELGTEVHPLRFRANVYFEATSPWEEFDWVDRVVQLGDIEARVIKPIQRCAAVHVNPLTAERDLPILNTLSRCFGHCNMGIYVQILQAGHLKVKDIFTVK